MLYNGCMTAVELKNTITKKVQRFKDQKSAADFLNMDKSQFHRLARQPKPVVNVPMFYVREIEPKTVRRYSVINRFTKKKKIYESSLKAAKDMSISSPSFRKVKNKKGSVIKKPLYEIKLIHKES